MAAKMRNHLAQHNVEKQIEAGRRRRHLPGDDSGWRWAVPQKLRVKSAFLLRLYNGSAASYIVGAA